MGDVRVSAHVRQVHQQRSGKPEWLVGCRCGWKATAPIRGKKKAAVDAWREHVAPIQRAVEFRPAEDA